MTDIDKWMENYKKLMLETFGGRVWFIGIQGSRGRGEAEENSDIDVVLILDRLLQDDLFIYEKAVSKLPERKLLCGFVSGLSELSNWDRADLFQFCHDTEDIFGSLNDLRLSVKRQDAERAAHSGACNIYHGLIHNMLHEKSHEILQGLFKQAGFVLRAVYFCENGIFLKRRDELVSAFEGDEKKIAELSDRKRFLKIFNMTEAADPHITSVFCGQSSIAAENADTHEDDEYCGRTFCELSALLMGWAKGIIERY